MDPDRTTLAEARIWLRDVIDKGAECPCCGQHAQVYRWSLYRGAVGLLMRMYVAGRTDIFVESKLFKVRGQGGDCNRLRLWKLVEHEADRRPDGGKSGWWRVTGQGESFLKGYLAIQKYVFVYDGQVLSYDGPGVLVTDIDSDFNWRDHMRGGS